MTSVLGATDVATRKMSAAGAPPPLPSWSAFRPLVGAAALTLAAGAVALAVTALTGARTAATYATVATLMLLQPSAASALGLVAGHRSVKSIAELIARNAAPPDIIVHEGPIENAGALEWYSGRRPVIVDGRRSVLGFGATRPEAAATFWDAARLELGLAGLAPRMGGHRPAAGAEPGGPAAGRAPGRRDRRAQPLCQPVRRAAIS